MKKYLHIKTISYLIFLGTFSCLFFSCKPTLKDLTILYGASLEEVQKRL